MMTVQPQGWALCSVGQHRRGATRIPWRHPPPSQPAKLPAFGWDGCERHEPGDRLAGVALLVMEHRWEYPEQCPTPLLATRQPSANLAGNRLFDGVIWTMVFFVTEAGYGTDVTMPILAFMTAVCLIVVTYKRKAIENRTAAEIVLAKAPAPAKAWSVRP